MKAHIITALHDAYFEYKNHCSAEALVPDYPSFKAGFLAALRPFPILRLEDTNGLQMPITYDDGNNLELVNIYGDSPAHAKVYLCPSVDALDEVERELR